MKRKVMMTGVAGLVFALALVGASAKANFSGTWTLDKTKSEGLPASVKDQVMTIKQEGDKLTIDSKLTLEQGEQVTNDVYTLDGKPADFTSKGMGGVEGHGKRTAKWSSDGNGIEVSEEINYDTVQGAVTVNIARKWALSADGKALTIDMDITSPMGSQHIKRVLVKKA
ncbi:MAG: hypothetical protein ICV60_17195 [Pyrinomonadaceae bacterium]|nr:hypothetical protein [Pyrinomonadaceae bacterium]